MSTYLKKMNHLKPLTYGLLLFFCLIYGKTYSQTTDYTGNWKLNEDKSDFGKLGYSSAPKFIKINQAPTEINIERYSKNEAGKDQSYIEKLNFDGRPVESQIADTHKTSSASWSSDHKLLTEHSIYKFLNRNGGTVTNKGTTIWSLSSDDKSLTSNCEMIDDDNVKYDAVWVYDKVQ